MEELRSERALGPAEKPLACGAQPVAFDAVLDARVRLFRASKVPVPRRGLLPLEDERGKDVAELELRLLFAQPALTSHHLTFPRQRFLGAALPMPKVAQPREQDASSRPKR